MGDAAADEASDTNNEFVLDDAFWESVSLLYGDVDPMESVVEMPLDYAGVIEDQLAQLSPT